MARYSFLVETPEHLNIDEVVDLDSWCSDHIGPVQMFGRPESQDEGEWTTSIDPRGWLFRTEAQRVFFLMGCSKQLVKNHG